MAASRRSQTPLVRQSHVAVMWSHRRLGEETPDLLRRLEAPILVVERGERQIVRAGDMARRDPGARIGVAAFEAAAPARVQQGFVHSPEEFLFGDDLAAVLLRL